MTEAADGDPSGGDLADESDDFDSGDFDSDEMPSPGDWSDLARRVLDATVYSAINPDEYKPVKIGRFDAISRIGEGGFGTVFKAHDPEFDRLVALKLCRTRSRHVAESIMAEARALAKLDHHPNIVTVYEPGRHDGGVFFAMQYIEGEDVAEFGEPGDPRPTVEEIADIYGQIGRGLAAAHRAGFVHGDIKPSNMLLDLNSFARLADFGLAQKVIRGAPESMRDGLRHRSGTLEFMAPEVLLGGSCSQAADQWALCVSILHTLYGWPPFRGKSTAALLEDIQLNRVKVIEHVEHPGLREILRVGLSLDPRDRFVDVDALVAALDRLGEPGPPVSSTPGEPESTPGEPGSVAGEPESTCSDPASASEPTSDQPELTPVGGGPAPSKAKRGAFAASLMLVGALGLTLGWAGRGRVGSDPVASVGELGMPAVVDHRGWTDGLASYSHALQAIDRGDVRAGYDVWVSGRSDVSRSTPRLDGELSLLLAKRVDERNPGNAVAPVVATWMANGAAESFERAQSWRRAAEARQLAAERGRAANLEWQAAHQERCALVNAMGRPC